MKAVGEIAEGFPFDIMKENYLKVLNGDSQSYKVRVYLISAQNLTATSTLIDWKSRLAGMTALSVANPYPVVSINDGFNPDKDNKQIKQHMDRDKAVEGSLNPQFF